MAERAFAPPVDPEILMIARQVAWIVRRVLGDPEYRVFLFGSWVAGEAAPRSDIDIGIDGPAPVPAAAMVTIRDACESLSTLRGVDLVDLARVPPGFREGLVARLVEPEPS
jgi:predicted nucleotidyltransferase